MASNWEDVAKGGGSWSDVEEFGASGGTFLAASFLVDGFMAEGFFAGAGESNTWTDIDPSSWPWSPV